jgi:HSP20 family molecular chaperone IbpA
LPEGNHIRSVLSVAGFFSSLLAISAQPDAVSIKGIIARKDNALRMQRNLSAASFVLKD